MESTLRSLLRSAGLRRHEYFEMKKLKRGTHSAVAAGAATRLDFCRVSVSVGAMIVAANLCRRDDFLV